MGSMYDFIGCFEDQGDGTFRINMPNLCGGSDIEGICVSQLCPGTTDGFQWDIQDWADQCGMNYSVIDVDTISAAFPWYVPSLIGADFETQDHSGDPMAPTVGFGPSTWGDDYGEECAKDAFCGCSICGENKTEAEVTFTGMSKNSDPSCDECPDALDGAYVLEMYKTYCDGGGGLHSCYFKYESGNLTIECIVSEQFYGSGTKYITVDADVTGCGKYFDGQDNDWDCSSSLTNTSGGCGYGGTCSIVFN